MSYGSDTAKLLERIGRMKDGKLDIKGLNLTMIEDLPETVKYLDCSNSTVKYIKILPNALKQLICSRTQLKELPPLPDTLEYLDCSYIQISALPKLSKSLTHLFCRGTPYMKVLPELPDSIKVIDCAGTPLISLPSLPKTIDVCITSVPLTKIPMEIFNTFRCRYLKESLYELRPNKDITQLVAPPVARPVAPPVALSVESLDVETYICSPEITCLPKCLPSTLRFLYCSNTKLTKLPRLPEKLEILHCKNTQIKVIPWPIPESLRVIVCFGSPLLKLQKKLGESNGEYINRWREWHIYHKYTLKARAIADELAEILEH